MILGPFLHKTRRSLLHCARWGHEWLPGSCGLLLLVALPPNLQLDKSTWVMEEKLVCVLREVNIDLFFHSTFKVEGRQKEDRACWCEAKNMSQPGRISSQVGQEDLCWKIWISDAKSAEHNQNMLSPLFKIILDYMSNRDQGSSEWHAQRHRQHCPAASMERDITCLTSQLRKNSPPHSKEILGKEQSNPTAGTDLKSVDVKITTRNIMVKLPVNAVRSWHHA